MGDKDLSHGDMGTAVAGEKDEPQDIKGTPLPEAGNSCVPSGNNNRCQLAGLQRKEHISEWSLIGLDKQLNA